MIRSPLRYPGGKSRAVERISALIPPFKEFREPFVGGGSVFIHLRQKFPDRKFWINDKYAELVVFWQQMQTRPESVLKQIRQWKEKLQNGKELHQFLRENKRTFDDVQLAAAFFVFNRITFSGTTEAGGFSEQAFQKRFTDSSVRRLEDFSAVLDGVKITNFDYAELIGETGEDVFLFCDPPYFSATKSALYGKNGSLHKHFDHASFAETMKNCRHRWLLTYDDSPFVREKFSFAEINDWNLMYGMRNQTPNSKQLGNELFIANHPLNQANQIALTFAR